ncbi:hypothetical protein A3D72_01100 [Candidatus Uhrbacteria bacterium RIFCSPHIGHO2_02_FULL_57_19]|uniref:Glycosyltransferase subfamily 4-like N-terminal domain-containing protein n=1 Tax=Candidatus Uhrbacteria bacterium RIFCSPHIGHO2_02_FULL_57_19 TaxID=1802391 RepID=A0A1F7U2C2_9BACT|nr:MAG: hypothetical protein A3D72_01100 [Candidatus Uhrbacteria bacterium RIFCSPHIGHO2_02_FULL_57_19]
MKTVFIMLSRGFVARNILRTDTFRLIAERSDLRIVLFVPRNIPDYFREEFVRYPNVVLEESDDLEFGKFRKKVFEPMLQKMVYSDTARFFMRYGGRSTKANKSALSAWLGHLGATLIAKLPFFIPAFRWIEFHAFPDRAYGEFFDKYQPDLVVATAIKTKRDLAMMKETRRRGVSTVGMARSWDNLDRILIAFPPDRLIVQNEVMSELGVRLHKLRPESISVTGFPQFDLYQNPETYQPRDEFLRSLGLDPARRVVMFASEGVWAPYGPLVADLLAELVASKAFGEQCSLVVRPHFSDLSFEREGTPYDHLVGLPNVFVDQHFRSMKFFTDKWDPSFKEMKHLANELKHADVLVTYATTLAIESSIVDTPIVNINYRLPGEQVSDGPFFAMFYGSSHYSNVVRSGATRLVADREALIAAVRHYLQHPESERAERRACALRLTYRLDGKSGERVAHIILGALGCQGVIHNL